MLGFRLILLLGCISRRSLGQRFLLRLLHGLLILKCMGFRNVVGILEICLVSILLLALISGLLSTKILLKLCLFFMEW